MVDMFQEMMEKMQQRSTPHPGRGGRFQRGSHDRRPRDAVCKVCNDSSHTTISHCMSERLCVCLLRPWPHQTKLPCQRLSSVTGKLADLYSEGDNTGRTIDSQKDDMFDAETVYTAVKDSCNNSEVVVYQNIHRAGNSESLFYTPVAMGGAVTLGGMLGSDGMFNGM